MCTIQLSYVILHLFFNYCQIYLSRNDNLTYQTFPSLFRSVVKLIISVFKIFNGIQISDKLNRGNQKKQPTNLGHDYVENADLLKR